jgi:hypothetical protein
MAQECPRVWALPSWEALVLGTAVLAWLSGLVLILANMTSGGIGAGPDRRAPV